MAGRGPRPKDADERVRGSRSDPMGLRIVPLQRAKQPALPTFFWTDAAGKRHQFRWPVRTRQWWKMWGESALAADFTETDWSELLDTALLHARFWGGDPKVAAELRLRVAKFGATPEDRARLRIVFAAANDAEGGAAGEGRGAAGAASPDGQSRRGRWSGLRAVGGGLDAVART